ncbi:MAG: N-formylglutamate amidohydrolase [Clostridia bacterium]|nr:N-formylglutamate amidohydrolase [Clostridia bacterium]
MKTIVILHIPHASVTIPAEYRSSFVADIAVQLKHMTDWYTDELFALPAQRLVFPVSRLVCDVERFRADAGEPMAAQGMGACYTRGYDRAVLRHLSAAQRESILRRYYDPHHAAFERLVRAGLLAAETCLVVDCHSFSAIPLPYEPDQNPDRADICIGTDAFHTPPALANQLARAFRERGYRVTINQPYAGSIVPLAFFGKEKRVQSVMIEVNRGLYLGENCEKLPAFSRLREDIAEALREGIQNFAKGGVDHV